MKNKRDPRKGKISKQDEKSFEDPFFRKKAETARDGEEGFEDPFFRKVDTIIHRLETDPDFYRLAATDLQAAIGPYRLTKEEMAALKDKAKNIRPPKGVRGFEDPIFA